MEKKVAAHILGFAWKLVAHRLAFKPGIMRRVKRPIPQTDRLRGTHLVVDVQRMAPFAQLCQYLLTDLSFNPNAVRLPLMMEARLGKGLIHREAKVDGMNNGQERLGNNGRATCRAHSQKRFGKNSVTERGNKKDSQALASAHRRSQALASACDFSKVSIAV